MEFPCSELYGQFKLEQYFEDRIKIGVIKPVDIEKIQSMMQERKSREKKQRYEQFIKLKQEFEPEN